MKPIGGVQFPPWFKGTLPDILQSHFIGGVHSYFERAPSQTLSRTHTHTHAHTYTHTLTHTHTQTHTQLSHMHKNTHTHTHTYTLVYTDLLKCIKLTAHELGLSGF